MTSTALRPGEVAARIVGIATHLPEAVLGNDDLAAEFPEWPAAKILEKTGIRERRVAAADETAGDLAAAAAIKLFEKLAIAPDSVDFLILCTQAPDYILPTTACILQDRLGLTTGVGAIDINLGCSGFVYGLSIATGLIAAGAAHRVLLLTADTYSKYIGAGDKSVRTLFGDGAAATLVQGCAPDEGRIGPFVFGTDGSGAHSLIVPAGGFRTPRSAATAEVSHDKSGNSRSSNNLYMHGGDVLSFSLREVPRAIYALCGKDGIEIDDYDALVLHQANKFMLDSLQKKLAVSAEKIPRYFEDVGNTVSSTIPFVLERLWTTEGCSHPRRLMLVGFGVGLSWAAASIKLSDDSGRYCE
jgi:3-oxoacyl-[acyl-carrier-protein] synthase-3